MTYALALQTPESPLTEEWAWMTDVLESYNGNEDRVPLLRYPKRTFAGQYEFDRAQDVRRQMALMQQRFGGTFLVPLYQYMVKLKAPSLAGATSVQVNATRSDLRAGRAALVIEGDKWELATVQTVAAGLVTFTGPLANAYGRRAHVCPVTECYTATGANVSRRNPDHSAMASFRYSELKPWTPHVSPLNTQVVATFAGMPVLDQRAYGSEFENTIDTGIQVSEGIGLPDVFTPWLQAQWVMNLRWLCNRVLDLNSWLWWQKFADTLQGASTVFLLPTQRADLQIVTPANGGGNQITVLGTEYSEHYWPLDTFKRVLVTSDAGRHYATVTGVSTVGGNNRLTISPALPAGAGWNSNQSISYMLKVRSADDKISIMHYGLQSEVAMAVRTVV